jgi:hypothetical protein
VTIEGVPPTVPRWRYLSVLPFAAALLVAAITRLLYPFDGLYGQDAFAYFRFARSVWPHLRWGAPLAELYWPRGYPVAVALLLPVFSEGPAAGQMVNALACACAAGATCAMVRLLAMRAPQRVAPIPAALAAGMAVALSGAVLRSTQVVMADGLGLALSAAAMFCAIRYAHSRRGHWLVACAVAIAWGAVTRWMVGLLALPVGLYLLLERRALHATARTRTSTVAWIVAATTAGLCILIPQLIAAHATPMSLEKHEWLQEWSLRNAFRRSFHTPEGQWAYRIPVGLFYLVRLGWPDYFFPTLGIFAVAGLWTCCRARWTAPAALLLGWLLVAWIFLSGIPYASARFLLPTLPVIAVLVGVGFGVSWRSTHAATRRLALFGLVMSLAAGLVAGAGEHGRQVERKAADLDLVNWAVARVPRDAELLVWGPTLAFEFYGARRIHALFSISDAELQDLVSNQRKLFLLADVDNLEGQWKGMPPEQRLTALRRHPGLSVIDHRQSYTLFAVESTNR